MLFTVTSITFCNWDTDQGLVDSKVHMLNPYPMKPSGNNDIAKWNRLGFFCKSAETWGKGNYQKMGFYKASAER
jgi:hypothetical protein